MKLPTVDRAVSIRLAEQNMFEKLSPGVGFLKIQLNRFFGEEVEYQKMFLALNFFTRRSSQKVGHQAQ